LLAQAIVRCCEELVPAGEGRAAIELITSSESLIGDLNPEWALRIQLVHAEALVAAELSSRALELVRQTTTTYGDVLSQLPDAAVRLEIIEGTTLWQLNRPDEAVEKLTRARTQLLAQPDTPLLARCTVQLSAAYWMKGDYRRSLDYGVDALVAARRSGNQSYEAQALTNYARTAQRLCRWTEAADAIQQALEIQERLGHRNRAIQSRQGAGILLWKRGRLEAALEMAEACARDGKARGLPTKKAMGDLLKSLIWLHQGHYDNARNIAAAIPEWDDRASSARAAILAHEFVGDVDLEQGDAVRAQVSYDGALARALAVVPKGDIVAELHRRRAECFYLLGSFDEAYTEAKAGLEHCRELGDRYEEAATYRVLALSAAAVGKPDEAKRWFDQGFAYYDDIETPYEWGKLWMAYGDWLLGPHAEAYADKKGALEAYYAARDHFERMGAEGKLAEVNTRLAKLVQPAREGAASHGQVADADLSEVRHTPRRPRRSTELERRSAWAKETFGLVTRNKALLALLDDVAKLAPSTAPILVLGESGTGKELVARGIHVLSGRKGQFMAINAGSLPREIIESCSAT
jgi:tetratricopeptide (TPR) repeat protein